MRIDFAFCVPRQRQGGGMGRSGESLLVFSETGGRQISRNFSRKASFDRRVPVDHKERGLPCSSAGGV